MLELLTKAKIKIQIFILKRNIVETLGSMQFSEQQLRSAKEHLERKNGNLGMTVNELRGSIAFHEDQINKARLNLPEMQEKLRRLQSL